MRFITTKYGTFYAWLYRPVLPFKESYEWFNDSRDSYSGKNTVTRFRNAARHVMEIESPIPKVDINNVYHLLHTYKTEQWAVPSWAEYQTISIAAGSTSVDSEFNVDETLPYIIVQNQYVAEVLIFESDGFDPLENDYVNALLIPLRIGHITTNADTFNNTISGRATFTFQSDINVDSTPAAPTQYGGYDVYTDTCSIFNSPYGLMDSISKRMDIIDSVNGLISYNSPWTCSRREREYRVFNESRTKYDEYKDFIYRRAGRYRQFWMPTWNGDLTLVTTGAITTLITVSEAGFSYCRSHIAVRKTDGTWLFREITDAVINSDDSIELTIASLGIDASEVERISYFGLHRLGTDRVEIGHITNTQSLSSISVVELA